jgi:hypothetical protein
MTPKNARKVLLLLRMWHNKTDPDFRSRIKDGFVGLRTTTPIVSVCFMQPLGGSIDRRGQPAWSRADHNHVAQGALFDSGVQSEAGSRFGIGRITQGDRAATDQDRNVR